MISQILNTINGQQLCDVAQYLVIYFPFNEEMCSYTDMWMGEMYANQYPLVTQGMWSGIIDLKAHKLLNWKSEFGGMYLQAKVCDSGTYFLLDKDKKVISKLSGYVPNGLIPDSDGCGDYIRLQINHEGVIGNWITNPNFSEFQHNADMVQKIDTYVREESILSIHFEFSYSQLMAELFRLPKFMQLEIGKALIKNAKVGFDEDE